MKALRFAHRHATRGIAIACIAQIIVVVFWFPRGVFSVDEVTQALMLRALVHEGALTESTRGLASPELAYALARVVDGRLVPQYPHGFAMLTAPLYAVLGLCGPMLVNSIAFYGTAALVGRLARLLFPQRTIGLFATAIFLLATFSWEYSPAIWPHASTVFLSTLAMTAALSAASATSARPRLGWALVAGVSVGVATTFRLDGVFVIVPAMLAPAITSRARWSTWTAMLAGLVPGFAFLAITNHAKFGTASPFSYGEPISTSPTGGIDRYVPFALAAALLLGATFVLSRATLPLPRRVLSRVAITSLAFSVLVVIAFEPARRLVFDLFDGVVMLGLDLRHSDPRVAEPALARTADGAMVYAGTVKKSLMQSLPYLPIAFAQLGLMRARDRRPLLVLVAAVLAPFSVFAALRWHGGMSFNLRYLLPILPFTSILVAVAVRRLLTIVPRRVARALDLVVLLSVLAFLVVLVAFKPQRASWAVQERFFLDFPLWLAAAMACAALAFLARHRRPRTVVASMLLVGTGVGLAWAGSVAFTYDALTTLHRRAYTARVGASIRGQLPAGSLLLVNIADPFTAALDDDVQLAVFSHDRGADISTLVRAAACRGRSAFVAIIDAPANEAARLVEASGLSAERIREGNPELVRATSNAPCAHVTSEK